MSILYFVFAEQIYWLFSSHDSSAWRRSACLPCACWPSSRCPALLIIYINALRGAGDNAGRWLFTVVGMLMVRLPLAYLCGVVLEEGCWSVGGNVRRHDARASSAPSVQPRQGTKTVV